MYEILMKYAVMGTLLTGVVCLFVLLVLLLHNLGVFTVNQIGAWPRIYRALRMTLAMDEIMENGEIEPLDKPSHLLSEYHNWTKQEVKT